MGTKVKHSAITLHHSFGNTQTNKHIRQGQKYVLTEKPGDQDKFFMANGGNIQKHKMQIQTTLVLAAFSARV